MVKNRHVYKRDGYDLNYLSTALGKSPEDCATMVAVVPGKYVVIDSDFTMVTKVDLNLRPV